LITTGRGSGSAAAGKTPAGGSTVARIFGASPFT
jgi:hypothetical protein